MPAPATPDPSDDVEPLLQPSDLDPFATIDPAKAAEMIADAIATATVVAPCLADPDFGKRAAAKAILRGAVLRWNDSGSGALSTSIGGPFQRVVDTRTPRRGMFWPSEIEQLQELCRTTSAGAFSIDPGGTIGVVEHADICAVNFGANYCSCGAIITARLPLYEQSW